MRKEQTTMTKLDLFVIIVCAVVVVGGIVYQYAIYRAYIKSKYKRGRYITYKKGAKK